MKLIRCDNCNSLLIWEHLGLVQRICNRCPTCRAGLRSSQSHELMNPLGIIYTPGSGTSYLLSQLHREAMLSSEFYVVTQRSAFDRLTRIEDDVANLPLWHDEPAKEFPKNTYNPLTLVNGKHTHSLIIGTAHQLLDDVEWLQIIRGCRNAMVTIHANDLKAIEAGNSVKQVMEHDLLLAKAIRQALIERSRISRFVVAITAVDLLASEPIEASRRSIQLYEVAFHTLRCVLSNTNCEVCVIPTSSIGFSDKTDPGASVRFELNTKPFNVVVPFDFLITGRKPKSLELRKAGAPAVHCFISYSRADTEFVNKLKEDLVSNGIATWQDIDDIRPGVSWDQAIENGIKECSHTVVVISPDGVSSQNVADEIAFARGLNKPVIPIIIKEAPLPLRIHRAQAINFASEYKHGFDMLLRALQEP